MIARKTYLFASIALSVLGACSAPDGSRRVEVVTPDPAQFAPVSEYLDHRCGSLDCHGAVGRNLRLVGYYGLRLSPNDTPGGRPTTQPETEANFRSVTALEPEILAKVVNDGGAHPERLTLVRKARGTENHKGGALVQVGDDQDTCLNSWLAGTVDDGACARALLTP